MVARRLSGVLKRALQTSLVVLERADCPHPDAIVTGNCHGMRARHRGFLREMVERARTIAATPPHFIPFHPRTPSAHLIAIRTGTHGYNNTFSHGEASFEAALLDAQLLLALGEAEQALVGAHDEDGECTVCFLDTEANGALCRLDAPMSAAELCRNSIV